MYKSACSCYVTIDDPQINRIDCCACFFVYTVCEPSIKINKESEIQYNDERLQKYSVMFII